MGSSSNRIQTNHTIYNQRTCPLLAIKNNVCLRHFLSDFTFQRSECFQMSSFHDVRSFFISLLFILFAESVFLTMKPLLLHLLYILYMLLLQAWKAYLKKALLGGRGDCATTGPFMRQIKSFQYQDKTHSLQHRRPNPASGWQSSTQNPTNHIVGGGRCFFFHKI